MYQAAAALREVESGNREQARPESRAALKLALATYRNRAMAALALARAGDTAEADRAAAEFQKFIDHRGVVATFPWGALARLGLARSYAMQGDTAKAKAAYQELLTPWKDADHDVPILIAAKSEYAKLQ